MNKELEYLIKIYSISFFFMMLSLLYRHIFNRDIDVLKVNISGLKKCNLWCVSHVLLYIILGYFSPNYWYVSILIGIIWEMFELLFQYIGVKYITSSNYDIVINMTGLSIGIVLSRILR
jgi:hypothetical protein